MNVHVASGCSPTQEGVASGLALFLTGFLSLLAQVVLLRELAVAFYGIEIAYLVALAAWMAATAGGAWLAGVSQVSALAERRVPLSAGPVTVVLALAALLVPLDVAFVRGSRILFGGIPGAYLPLERQLFTLAIAVVPMAALFGVAFALAARQAAGAGGRPSSAYAIECCGAAAAGLMATGAFRLGAQNFEVAVAVAAVGVTAWARGRLLPLALATVGLLAAWQSRPLDHRLTRWTHPALADTRDTPYARVTITRAGSQRVVFENDVLTHDSESADNEELPHLAALQAATGARILLLGGGVERMDGALALHHPRTVEHIEIDRVMLAAVGRRWSLAAAPRIADPRAVLALPAEYDLVVIATGAPVSGQSNRFYTREFFGACARRVAPGGVVALRLDVPANYLGPSALLRAASVARALRGAFRYTDFLPGVRAIALASNAPLPAPDVVAARIGERQLGTHLVTAGYVRYLYSNDRRADLRAAFDATAVGENRDRQPIAYLYAAATWLSKFQPALIGADWTRAADWRRWPAAVRWGVPLALVLALAACRLRAGMRRAALAFVAGLAGMLLDTIVLLHYQATAGALFEDLGALMMAFMAGSAVGSWGAGRERARRKPPPLRAGAWPLVALAGWGLLCWWIVAAQVAIGMAGGLAVLAGVGATVGALFAAASREQADAGSAGRLYGADVIGGGLGSLAASLVLVPLAGMDLAALTVSALAAASLALLSGRTPR